MAADQRHRGALQLLRTEDAAAGGPTTYLVAVERALQHRAWRVERLSVCPSLADNHAFAFAAAWRFGRRLMAALQRADIVHIHGIFGWHVLLGAGMARRSGRPYVVSPHGHLQAEALAQKGRKKRAYIVTVARRVLARANAVVVTTAMEGDAVRAIEPKARVVVIAPGVAVPARPAGSEHGSGASREALHVMYLGRLHPHKNIDVAVDAVARLRARGIDARLSIVGEGDPVYRRRLQGDVDRLGLGGAVAFTGFLRGDAVRTALRAAHVLLLPSRSENFSFAVAEALAEGLPVVVTDGVGLAAMVRDADCGRVVPVGDAEAMAAAAAEFRNDARRREAGYRAHSLAQQSLSLDAMGEALERLYGDAAARVQA